MTIHSRIKTILDTQGELVTYRRVTAQTRSTSTLKKTNTLTNTSNVNAHIRLFKDTELSGLIQAGDREMRIAAEEITFIPNNDDRVNVAGTDFNVVSVSRCTANGSNAMYVLTIRGTQSASI